MRGGRSTDPADYPAELTAYTLRAPDRIKRGAAEHGPAVAEFAQRLFDRPLPWAKVRQGHKLIRLGQRYTPQRLDDAYRKALAVDLIDMRRVERILVEALEQSEVQEHSQLPTRLESYLKDRIPKALPFLRQIQSRALGQPLPPPTPLLNPRV